MQKRNTGSARNSLLPIAMFVIGILMIVRTITSGGGPLSLGVLLGILFTLAGAGRFYVGRVSR